MPDSTTSQPRRAFKARFLEMLGRDDPPELVAASFALGVAISFTPLLGLHWVIALLLAIVLKLNKVDVLLGTLVVNPLTIGPVSAVAIPLGRIILRAEREAISHLPWRELLKRSFWHEAGPKMRAIGLQWGVGMFILALLSGSLTYVLLVYVIRRHRSRLSAAAALPPGVVPGPGDDATPPSSS
jgi:uncharacterized protein (DUF2062 family)